MFIADKNDELLFERIYKFKLLTMLQCWKAAYINIFPDPNTFYKERLNPLIREKYLDIISTDAGPAARLTKKSLDAIREYRKIPYAVHDEQTGRNRRTLYKPSELILNPKFENHNLALNDFLIDFIRNPGYELHPHSLMGEILFVADNKQEAVDILRTINNNVSVFNLDGEDVMIHFDDYYKIA